MREHELVRAVRIVAGHEDVDAGVATCGEMQRDLGAAQQLSCRRAVVGMHGHTDTRAQLDQQPGDLERLVLEDA